MRLSERLHAVLGGVASGLSGGLFGVGGGIILVPILTRRFGATQHQAHGTSLAVMGLTALSGVVVYALHGSVRWSTALWVALASAVTARYGARLATRTSSLGLSRAFSVFLAIVAVRLLVDIPEPVERPLLAGAPGVVLDLVLGAAVGVLAGYMGVGGGILAVPVFTLVLGMSQQAAQGTSLAIILVTGPAAAIEHARHGNVLFALVPALAIGALIGAPLASWIAQLVSHPVLVRGFAVFLLVNAAFTWIRPPGAKRPT